MHNGPALFDRAMGLERIALKMTERGVAADCSRFASHATLTRAKAREGRKLLISVARHYKHKNLNPHSHGEVHNLFFKQFGLKVTKRSEITGKPSLDDEVLRRLVVHPNMHVRLAARGLGSFRRWSKLYSYVKNPPAGYVYHVRWRVNGARTGRWSSSPNLQNIPQPHEIRGVKSPSLRDLFVARKGLTLVAADYSQLELRIAAALANDEPLLEGYARGEDVHTMNARGLFSGFDALTEDQQKARRYLAKRFAYAVLYGAEPPTIWENLAVEFPDLTLGLVSHLVERWFTLHPAMRRWQILTHRDACKHKYIECPLSGRRQYYPDGNADFNEVLNYPNQGTAADLIDMAIQELAAVVDWRDTAILIQCHDELVCEARDVNSFAQQLVHSMTRTVVLNGHEMTFPVEVKTGPNWKDLEPWQG